MVPETRVIVALAGTWVGPSPGLRLGHLGSSMLAGLLPQRGRLGVQVPLFFLLLMDFTETIPCILPRQLRAMAEELPGAPRTS